MGSEVKQLVPAAIAVVALAIAVVTGIIVLIGYKGTGLGNTASNSSIDQFVIGLTIFGAFVGVLVLAIIGKMIISMFKKGD